MTTVIGVIFIGLLILLAISASQKGPDYYNDRTETGRNSQSRKGK